MRIRELRALLGITQGEFAERYHIPFRTVQNWEKGVRNPPEYVLNLLTDRVHTELINRKTSVLPKYHPKKMVLPIWRAQRWLYGSDTVARFPGVVVVGDHISPICVQQRNGRFITDFNRTISGALANESLLDMQGITEAINYYRD